MVHSFLFCCINDTTFFKVGYVHYFCTGAGILCEASGFVNAAPFHVHIKQGENHTVQVKPIVFHKCCLGL